MGTTHPNRDYTEKLTIRHVLIVVTGILVCFGPATLVFNTWSILVVPVCNSLNVPTGAFTFYVSCIFLFSALAAPFAGNLMNRFDARIVITISCGLVSVGIFASSFYSEVWQFYISGAIEGIGVVTLVSLVAPTLINRWYRRHMGVLIGICVAMMGVGAAAWNMLGGFLLGEFDWRMCYAVFGVISAVISMPATAFLIRSYPEDAGLKPYGKPAELSSVKPSSAELTSKDSSPTKSSHNTDSTPSFRRAGSVSAKRAFRMPAFFLLAITIALNNGVAQMGNYLATYLYFLSDSGSLGISPAEVVIMASIVASCLQIAQACAKVGLGQIADHSIRASLFIACSCGLLGILFCWQGARISPLCFYVGAAFFGILFGATNVLGPTITRYLFGPKDYTVIYSRVAIVVNFLPVLFIPIFAALSDIDWNLLFAFATTVVVIIFACAIILMKLAKNIKSDEIESKSTELENPTECAAQNECLP